MEHKVINLIGRILVSRYNFSLVVMTVLWWLLCCYFGFWSTYNFDMIRVMGDYIVLLSFISMAIGLITNYRYLAKLGVITALLGVFTVAACKSTLTSHFSTLVLVPLSQFCFLLLIKNIWLVADLQNDDKNINNSKDGNNNKTDNKSVNKNVGKNNKRWRR